MKCDEERVQQFVDGELEGGELEEVRRHIEECHPCRELARKLKKLEEALGRLESPEVSEERWGRVEERVLRPRRWRRAWVAAATAAVFVGLVVGTLLRGRPLEQGWKIESLEVSSQYSATIIANDEENGYIAIVYAQVEEERNENM